MGRDTHARVDHDRRGRRKRGLAAAVAGVALMALVAGCGAQPSVDQPKANGSPVVPNVQGKGCTTPAAGESNGKQWKTEPDMAIDQKAAYTMTLNTNCGAITIALETADAPRTVNSFVFLAGEKFFDHTKCHRLTTKGLYVLQCGDPTGTGMGGPGYEIPDENLSGAKYPAGTVAMANAGPDTGGSQFFLVFKDAELPPSYTPFGRITSGMDKLQAIADSGVAGGSSDGKPKFDVVFDGVTTAKA